MLTTPFKPDKQGALHLDESPGLGVDIAEDMLVRTRIG